MLYSVLVFTTLCFLLKSGISRAQQYGSRPNIIFIMVDDLGWNDVGYHGSEIYTPNLDQLADNGVKLENYYTSPVCGPTRAQLLTGRYSIHLGTNGANFIACKESGVPTNFPTIADKLKELNYSTHLVGKWHAGFHTESHLPTNRGFDTFRGSLLGHGDHYKHTRKLNGQEFLDYHDNTTPYNESWGHYSTDIITDRAVELIQDTYGQGTNESETSTLSDPMFLYISYQAPHNPLQVPDHYMKNYDHILSNARARYAAMVTAIDIGVGRIVENLKSAGVYNNTVIVFSSDNGGDDGSGGNNFPLKGRKGSFYQGGIRAVGFVSSPLISRPQRSVYDLMHVTDWMPTLLHIAGGGDNHNTALDGFNQWSTISSAQKSARQEVLHNIKSRSEGRRSAARFKSCAFSTKRRGCQFNTRITAALTVGRWKILTGRHSGNFHHADPVSHPILWERQRRVRRFTSQNTVQVYNLALDPEERYNIARRHPDITDMLLSRLKYHQDNISDSVIGRRLDPRCDPALHGGVWGPFM